MKIQLKLQFLNAKKILMGMVFAGLAFSSSIQAAPPTVESVNWPMASLNHEATRNQSDGTLAKKFNNGNLPGIKQLWFFDAQNTIQAEPVVVDDIVYVGDNGGVFYAIKTDKNGKAKELWHTNLTGAIIDAALVDDGTVYIGTQAGWLYALNAADGAIKWSTNKHANTGRDGLFWNDQVWTGPLKVGDTLFVAFNPGEEASARFVPGYLFNECCIGSGHVVAIDLTDCDSTPGAGCTVKWDLTYIDNPGGKLQDDHGRTLVGFSNFFEFPGSSDTTFKFGPSGAGTWSTSMAYSEDTGLLYVTTGQGYSPLNQGQPSGFLSDEKVSVMMAIDPNAKLDSKKIRWFGNARDPQKDFAPRRDDVWNFAMLYDPTVPSDMDNGDGIALYHSSTYGKLVAASGDKRGMWYVRDAVTGELLNGNGNGLNTINIGPDFTLGISHGFPTTTGGFNVQHGVAMINNKPVVFAPEKSSGNDQLCAFTGGNASAPACGALDVGQLQAHMVAISGDGNTEKGRFIRTDGSNFVGGLVIANSELLFVPNTVKSEILVLDAAKLADGETDVVIKTIELRDNDGNLLGANGGASMSLSNGKLYIGSGFNNVTNHGLFAIGFK